MRVTYKIVVTGAFNAGKTTFVNTLSDIDTVNTDREVSNPIERAIKRSTTTALDYGQLYLDDNITLHLFGTPGQPRFEFMRDILAQGMDGFIFLIDSSDFGRLDEAGRLLTIFNEADSSPFIVAANKTDLNAINPIELRLQLNLPASQPVTTCVATQRDSALAVVNQLVSMLK